MVSLRYKVNTVVVFYLYLYVFVACNVCIPSVELVWVPNIPSHLSKPHLHTSSCFHFVLSPLRETMQ